VEREDDPEFATELLTRLSNDDIGQLCRTEPMILIVGKYLFKNIARNPAKKIEIRKSTMSSMRNLARLYIAFKKEAAQDVKIITSAEELLHRCNFKYLHAAIENLTMNGNELKFGMKLAYGNFLKVVADIMKGTYLIGENDEMSDSVDKFTVILKLQWAYIFGNAEYRAVQNRNSKTRRPGNLPLEENITIVRNYSIDKITEIMSDPYFLWTPLDFSRLRDLVVCRLTFFNARRGGEPCRLLRSEWKDANNGVWIAEGAVANVTEEVARNLLNKYKVAFQSGKGSKRDVPIFIPQDCITALRKLDDLDFRTDNGIHPNNTNMFPSTHKSMEHVVGWTAVSNVCKLADVFPPITATATRHRASNIYSNLTSSDFEKDAFYRHMGHSAEINMSVYQCPIAMQEIVNTGRYFDSLDNGVLSLNNMHSKTNATVSGANFQSTATSTLIGTLNSNSVTSEEPLNEISLSPQIMLENDSSTTSEVLEIPNTSEVKQRKG